MSSWEGVSGEEVRGEGRREEESRETRNGLIPHFLSHRVQGIFSFGGPSCFRPILIGYFDQTREQTSKVARFHYISSGSYNQTDPYRLVHVRVPSNMKFLHVHVHIQPSNIQSVGSLPHRPWPGGATASYSCNLSQAAIFRLRSTRKRDCSSCRLCDLLSGTCDVLPTLDFLWPSNFHYSAFTILTGADCFLNGDPRRQPSPPPQGYSAFFKVLIISSTDVCRYPNN